MESRGNVLARAERTYLSSDQKITPEKEKQLSLLYRKISILVLAAIILISLILLFIKSAKKRILIIFIIFAAFSSLYLLTNYTREAMARNGSLSSTRSQDVCIGGGRSPKCLTMTQSTMSLPWWGTHQVWTFQFGNQQFVWGCVNHGENVTREDVLKILKTGKIITRVPPPPPPAPAPELPSPAPAPVPAPPVPALTITVTPLRYRKTHFNTS